MATSYLGSSKASLPPLSAAALSALPYGRQEGQGAEQEGEQNRDRIKKKTKLAT